jgi:hypothetical protein
MEYLPSMSDILANWFLSPGNFFSTAEKKHEAREMKSKLRSSNLTNLAGRIWGNITGKRTFSDEEKRQTDSVRPSSVCHKLTWRDWRTHNIINDLHVSEERSFLVFAIEKPTILTWEEHVQSTWEERVQSTDFRVTGHWWLMSCGQVWTLVGLPKTYQRRTKKKKIVMKIWRYLEGTCRLPADQKIQAWILKDPWLQVTRIRRSHYLQVFPRVCLQVTFVDPHPCPALLSSIYGTIVLL